MTTVNARFVGGPQDAFSATRITRRDLAQGDVLIDIAYAGVCHSDLSYARNEWGNTIYPLVPGHEITGHVSALGPGATKFALGDRVGVGVTVDSCRHCESCRRGFEQFCSEGHIKAYNSIGRDGRPNQGGYSEKIVVHEDYVVRIPDALALPQAAPLLCAGITMYSPLKRWQAGPGKRVAILGFGGLGHVGVQISSALGAHTTVLDLSLDKRDDGIRLGANDYRATSDPALFVELSKSFDLLISTVPANLDYDAYMGLLAIDGTFVNAGVPVKPISLSVYSLFTNRRSMAGTSVGGIRETQEMLDFCAEHNIVAEIEMIGADQIDMAFERLAIGDVRYRFVLDIATMHAN
ncbi:NAD(P)-dependent alcohol dehydrogenase [Variovorax sp. J22R133]|uniref:NAD(P)-dependent alcohol dehydrogenase n=1 Tax=Variovorax brevis TaxID=3053503 RepID=UPI002578B03F|nr:NAD(P)-dependent alcohol dehydrogenase [Variovorax sp. J22R133]MDM0116285.1 NAD(P)-dependent alcohol dehydrogenase [Variovorax sp. J22R133]